MKDDVIYLHVAISREKCFVVMKLCKKNCSMCPRLCIVESSVTDRNRRAYRNNYRFLLKGVQSIFLSMASRKFIHYTGPAMLDDTGSDSWTANPIEVGCSPQQQIKSYFILLPAKILSSLALALFFSPSFSLSAAYKLVHQSSLAPIFLFECCCCCCCPTLLTPPVSLS